MSGTLAVAQITDPHLWWNEPARRRQLEATVDAVAALGVPLTAVLVTGDVTDNGRVDESVAARKALARLEAPLVVLGGNHDGRAALRAAFELAGDDDEPVRGATYVETADVQAGGHGRRAPSSDPPPRLRVVWADTTIPGDDAGTVDVPWIAEQLAADRSTPTLLALHHPPTQLGSPGIDELGVPAEDRLALALVLARTTNVLAVLTGHVHRATRARLGGVPVITAPSSNAQLAFDLDTEATGLIEVAPDEPPAVLLHLLVDGALVTHVVPVPRAE